MTVDHINKKLKILSNHQKSEVNDFIDSLIKKESSEKTTQVWLSERSN